ncbi:MAG: bifunctional riboflavin kinase/FAD synthetase [Williamsia sp.]|nr:bifunctional riboflavin kinase/FAD synthetase [Williamsia sp.]
MKVYTDITHLSPFRHAVVTIGTYDGVHLGHRQIIHQLTREAKSVDGETVIITFDPHPRTIINPSASIHLITTLQEKTELLEQLGVDNLVVVPFEEKFANFSASGYVEDFLLHHFHPHTLIIGYDHRFGKGRKGDFRLLEEYAQKQQFRLIEIPQHVLHKAGISSTRIREELLNGNLEKANELLGYTYFFEGTVVKGNQLGRTIGYPTANIAVNDPQKIVPGKGVYAVLFQINDPSYAGKDFAGMMNIGVRPTVDGTREVIEVNVFGFDDDIYGKNVRVWVRQRLRAEKKFGSLDELKEQLAKDKEQAMLALL